MNNRQVFKMAEKATNNVQCECGSILLKKNLKRHLDSKKHKKFVIDTSTTSCVTVSAMILKEDEIRKASITSCYAEIQSLKMYYAARKESWDFHQSYPKMFKLHSIWSNSSIGKYRILECDTFEIIPDANIPNDVYDTSIRLKKIEKEDLTCLNRCREFTRENLKKGTMIFNLLECILFRIKVQDEDESYRDADLLLNRNNTITNDLIYKLEHIKRGQIVVIRQTPTGIDFFSIPY